MDEWLENSLQIHSCAYLGTIHSPVFWKRRKIPAFEISNCFKRVFLTVKASAFILLFTIIRIFFAFAIALNLHFYWEHSHQFLLIFLHFSSVFECFCAISAHLLCIWFPELYRISRITYISILLPRIHRKVWYITVHFLPPCITPSSSARYLNKSPCSWVKRFFIFPHN